MNGELKDQFERMRGMWSEVVFAAIDDAIEDSKKFHDPTFGMKNIARWVDSRDGREVLDNAGLDVTDLRIKDRLIQIVQEGKRTAIAFAEKKK